MKLRIATLQDKSLLFMLIWLIAVVVVLLLVYHYTFTWYHVPETPSDTEMMLRSTPRSLPWSTRLMQVVLRVVHPIRQRSISNHVRMCDIKLKLKGRMPVQMIHVFIDQDVPGPVVLIRTPYESSMLLPSAGRFATAGYHVIIAECRKEFLTDEAFPLQNEGIDGVEIVQWIEKQSFFNGSIGMYGPSYLGKVQYALVDEAKKYDIKSLKAIVPINSCSNIFDATYPLGVLNLELLARWVYLMLQCRDPNAAGLSRAIRLARTVSQMNLVYKHLPLITFDEILLGKRVQFIRDILEHLQANDPFWVQRGMKLDLCDHGNCPPANLLTGWYDVFIRGALKDFEKLQNAGIDSRLTIGNWCHWDILLQTKHGIDDALEWFDVYLNGKKSDGLFNYPIKLFLMGRNSWLSLKHFPPKDATLTEFLLSENGLLLQESKMTRYMNTESLNSNRFVHYKFDPKDPTPSIGGASFDCNNTGPKNNAILEKRADIAIFSSEIIAEEVTVIGYIRARILVWSSSEHAHFIARLCDVSPSNESIILCDGIAKISEGTKILTLSSIECDGKTFDNIGIYEVTIDMAATANVFRVGHRVRVHIASGAHPRWARNLGNGTDHTGTIENSRESMQAIFYQVGDRLSSVSLPLTRIAQ